MNKRSLWNAFIVSTVDAAFQVQVIFMRFVDINPINGRYGPVKGKLRTVLRLIYEAAENLFIAEIDRFV